MKRLSLLIIILSLASLGVVAGQTLTYHLMERPLVRAQEKPEKDTQGERVIPEKLEDPVQDEKLSEKERKARKQNYKQLELFQKVLHYVEKNYVEEVEYERLIKGAIDGMLSELDPHSNLLTKKVFQDMKVDTEGKFGGLGIKVGKRDDVLTVITPIEGTPAWEAGLKPGDRIIKVNGKSTKGMSLSEAVSKMRGEVGSKIDISIYRDGFDSLKPVTIKREEIKIHPVEHQLLEPGYGYIRLKTFNEMAAKEIEAAMKNFKEKGPIKGVILDLRYNPGGLLEEAVKVASLFVEQGEVVSTKGRDASQEQVKRVRQGKTYQGFPMATLVNSSTASAAEIVAGALQDHDRSVVMGQPTFGKGSVQTVNDLGNGMGLKLTIARYYTPNGRSIQEKGVQPDVLLEDYDPELLEEARIKKDKLRERDLKGHIQNQKEGRMGGYTQKELENLDEDDSESKEEKQDSEKTKDQEMNPIDFDPEEDYQVKEGLKYLKSYEIFQRISGSEASGG